MEDGVCGLTGVIVLSPVEGERRSGHGSVTILLQAQGDNTVKDMRMLQDLVGRWNADQP